MPTITSPPTRLCYHKSERSRKMSLLSDAWDCIPTTVQQGAYLSAPILASCLAIRLLVFLPLHHLVHECIAASLGLYMLWWYIEGSLVYFLLLLALIYTILLIIPQGRRGVAVGSVCVLYIATCELIVSSAVEWHKSRGCFVILSMKLVSLAFDIDKAAVESPASSSSVPHPVSFLSYALFPATIILGPFITYTEYLKFTSCSTLSVSWLVSVIRSFLLAMLFLAMSSCVAPMLFPEHHWNKWMTAYSTAASFRYSHFFVCLLSQCSLLMAGLGFSPEPDGSVSWYQYRVARPLNVEIPRSLGVVVTSWNLPMHQFLKNYVFKPAVVRIDKFGAILATYIASALLHGLNFQLAAVLLSIGLFAYIENVFRYKLSKHLDACVLDRRCSSCEHKYGENVFWVSAINTGFIFLAMFHLAYLGLMFGIQDTDDQTLAAEGYSMAHALRQWGHLDYLSHYIAGATAVVAWLL